MSIPLPTTKKTVADIHESCKLAQLRDYLLPKLLSGTIRVGDTERQAATVA